MRHWSKAKRRALASLGQISDPLFSNMSIIARDLGFDCWQFAVLDHDASRAPLMTLGNWPQAWSECYEQHRLYAQDPRHQHGLCSLQPLHWDVGLFEQAPRLWQAMCDIDLTHGMTQACHHSSGVIALLSFARNTELGSDEFHCKVDAAVLLANQLTVASVERVARDAALIESPDESSGLLTPREIAVLELAATGHTVVHIAARMALSERTVQFHISSTLTKLDVPNKTAAVAKAILLGLIFSP